MSPDYGFSAIYNTDHRYDYPLKISENLDDSPEQQVFFPVYFCDFRKNNVESALFWHFHENNCKKSNENCRRSSARSRLY